MLLLGLERVLGDDLSVRGSLCTLDIERSLGLGGCCCQRCVVRVRLRRVCRQAEVGDAPLVLQLRFGLGEVLLNVIDVLCLLIEKRNRLISSPDSRGCESLSRLAPSHLACGKDRLDPRLHLLHHLVCHVHTLEVHCGCCWLGARGLILGMDETNCHVTIDFADQVLRLKRRGARLGVGDGESGKQHHRLPKLAPSAARVAYLGPIGCGECNIPTHGP